MSLKSALRITLVVAILFASLCGAVQPSTTSPNVSIYAQSSPAPFVGQSIPASHPVLACAGCSGNGGGPA